ncbi:hypothetical protein [Methylobacterium pseudosasicola]|uniref:Uncharacterized protein n=1 Tax=Methylobacterium pseudosasicola TaxID=582667 RepID=A0A1I4RLN3_9HYPH|nr:hypothetical protein [Methylobacterium pseudosasicola]SFM52890.1 hypothetical protein SAMN05192568_103636 [Methylobacterium pseudosasicola]
MAEDNTLTKALVDVRARRAALQSDYDRISAELTKLRAAEAALTAIVEGVPLKDTSILRSTDNLRPSAEDQSTSGRSGRRGARGPRSNSAKGRLKALLGSAGPQGLTHAEIAERLSDVASNTLNTYLSMMVTGGEAVRRGDFFTAAEGAQDDSDDPQDEPDQDDEAPEVEETNPETTTAQ